MCGIFGFATKNGQGPHLGTLAKIAIETEKRGRHAFGFAWLDKRGRLKMYKQSGPISRALDVLALAHDAQLLIGHCRYATQGSPENNLNNHPHACDGGWLVHNGMIRSYERIVQERDLRLVTECDSEVLAALVETLDGTLLERMIGAAQIAGDSPLAMMALWRSPSRMIVVKRGNPLCFGESSRGYYLASLLKGLPGKAFQVADDKALSFTLKNNRATLVAYEAGEPADVR